MCICMCMMMMVPLQIEWQSLGCHRVNVSLLLFLHVKKDSLFYEFYFLNVNDLEIRIKVPTVAIENVRTCLKITSRTRIGILRMQCAFTSIWINQNGCRINLIISFDKSQQVNKNQQKKKKGQTI